MEWTWGVYGDGNKLENSSRVGCESLPFSEAQIKISRAREEVVYSAWRTVLGWLLAATSVSRVLAFLPGLVLSFDASNGVRSTEPSHKCPHILLPVSTGS